MSEVFLTNMQLVKEGKLVCKQNKCRKYISENGGYRTIGTKAVEQFWKDLGKVYPFTDEELSESISNKKAIIDEIGKEADNLSCVGV